MQRQQFELQILQHCSELEVNSIQSTTLKPMSEEKNAEKGKASLYHFYNSIAEC